MGCHDHTIATYIRILSYTSEHEPLSFNWALRDAVMNNASGAATTKVALNRRATEAGLRRSRQI